MKLNRTISHNTVDTLLDCVAQRCNSQLRDVMVAAIVHTVHSIWLARNAIRFNVGAVSLHTILAKITSLITMSGTTSKGKCLSYDVIFENLFVPPLHRRVRDIIPVVWKAPTITRVKANTDGSVRNLFTSCGGIFRDFRGTFLGGFACNLGGGSAFEAELYGPILAMEHAAKNNWTRLWLESD